MFYRKPGLIMPRRRLTFSISALEFVYLASGGGTTATVTVPGTPTAGDLCIIWTWGRNTFGTGPGAGPSGFTELLYENTNGGGSLHAKKLLGSETTVTTYLGGAATRWIAVTFHPSRSFSGFSWTTSGSESAAGNPVAQSIVTSGTALRPLLLLGQMGSSGTISPRTSGSLSELNDHASTQHYIHYLTLTTGALADQAYDMDDEGAQNVLQSGYLSFT